TNDDFIVLNQMLAKYLEYEKKGRLGRFQRGWHSMFSDDEIHKIRESLGRSRDALRMSALVFRWSLGDAKADASVGIGYTGLAAVLERISPGRASAIGASPASIQQPIQSASAPVSEVPDRLPPLPPISTVSEKHANYSLFPRLDEELNALTGHTLDSHNGSVDHRNGDLPSIHRHGDSNSIKALPSIRSSKYTATSTARELGLHSSTETAATDVTLEDHLSVKTADSFTQIEDMISEIEFNDKQSQKVVRIKADPATVPRWTPKQNT
ncbi:hypothetical protein LTR40_013014, partial [Exophiala xenobiotica]